MRAAVPRPSSTNAREPGLSEREVDLIFHALSDATRRDIVRRCIEGESSVSGLAAAYPMSFAAVQKHVAVLEQAGLVTKQRHGREQHVRTDLDTVHQARDLLDKLERAWRGRVSRMDALLDELPADPSRDTSAGEES